MYSITSFSDWGSLRIKWRTRCLNRSFGIGLLGEGRVSFGFSIHLNFCRSQWKLIIIIGWTIDLLYQCMYDFEYLRCCPSTVQHLPRPNRPTCTWSVSINHERIVDHIHILNKLTIYPIVLHVILPQCLSNHLSTTYHCTWAPLQSWNRNIEQRRWVDLITKNGKND